MTRGRSAAQYPLADSLDQREAGCLLPPVGAASTLEAAEAGDAMGDELKRERCVPCHSGSPRATPAEIAGWRHEVPAWTVVERDGVLRLERVFRFPDFVQALAFANRVGALAEEEGHHPALLVEWGRVTVTWWTHAIEGLHRNDFIMAARTDACLAE